MLTQTLSVIVTEVIQGGRKHQFVVLFKYFKGRTKRPHYNVIL